MYFTTKDDFKVDFSQEGAKAPTVFVTSGRIGQVTLMLESMDDLAQLKTFVDNRVEWLKKQ